MHRGAAWTPSWRSWRPSCGGEEGTLYPLLRRLEAQGVLESSWDVDGASPRRYYQLSKDGRRIHASLRESWRNQVSVMNTLLE